MRTFRTTRREWASRSTDDRLVVVAVVDLLVPKISVSETVHFSSVGGHLQSSCVHIYTQKSSSDGKQDKSGPAISHQNLGPPARGRRVRHVLALAPPGRATHPPTRSHARTHATHSFSRRAAQHLLLLPQQGDRQRKRHDRLRKRDRSTQSMRGFCGTSASDQERDHDSMSHWLTRTRPLARFAGKTTKDGQHDQLPLTADFQAHAVG